MKKQQYYKVVRVINNTLHSAISNKFYDVKYEVDKEVFPHEKLPKSKLFVFDSLEAAQKFVAYNIHRGDYAIYMTDVKNPHKKETICSIEALNDTSPYYKNELLNAWNDNWCWFQYRGITSPQGNMCVDSVTLRERVDFIKSPTKYPLFTKI